MAKILVDLPNELKLKLEQHPDHHYGNCNDFYISIIQKYVDSAEYALAIEKRRTRSLEYQLTAFKQERDRQKADAERYKKLWQASGQPANIWDVLRPAAPAPATSAAPKQKGKDAA